MISVAMATYNSEKYIIEQLDSIRNQTINIDEVVIIDDSSKDNTYSILEDYKARYSLNNWSIYKHTINKGFIKTFSEALLMTTGDVIILSDHDDIWMPNKAEVIYNCFKEKADILALATSFIEIDENGKERPQKKYFGRANNGLIRHRVKKESLSKVEFDDCLAYNISPGCTCAMAGKLRNDYKSVTDEGKLPHDWKINILAACKNGLYYLDVATTYYRIYSGNTYGLGHQKMLNKRISLSESALSQKNDMLHIVEQKGSQDDIAQVKKIVDVFRHRCEFMHGRHVFREGIRAFIGSLQFPGLCESVIYDAYVMIKGKVD